MEDINYQSTKSEQGKHTGHLFNDLGVRINFEILQALIEAAVAVQHRNQK